MGLKICRTCFMKKKNPCHRIVHIAYTTGSGSRRSGYTTPHESAGCVAGNVRESQAHTVLGQWMFRPIEKQFRSNEVDSMKDCEAMINQSCEANDALRICWRWVEWDVFLAKFFLPVKGNTCIQALLCF